LAEIAQSARRPTRARRARPWLQALLLAAPLALFSVWVVRGALRATHGPILAAAPPTAAAPLAGLPPPAVDLGADRLEDRVDGDAEYLRAQGCRRLLHWRLEDRAADLDVLWFSTEAGAAAVLARDVGPERTPGPGDEAQLSAEAVYFRRGPALVRLLADPGAPPGDALARTARQVDRALIAGGPS